MEVLEAPAPNCTDGRKVVVARRADRAFGMMPAVTGLPDMDEGVDDLFDESYARLYAPVLADERSHAEAVAAARLADVAPGAEILDCPCGFGRHAFVLAAEGYRITGADRSLAQLEEAKRRRGTQALPRLVQADYRDLPFADASFDAAFCLGGSLGYLPRAGDVCVLAEFRRVLRPGGALVFERTHRDSVARSSQDRSWARLPDGALLLRERTFDLIAGTVENHQLHIAAEGQRSSRRYLVHVHTATEWVAMVREAGFTQVECFGDWERSPPALDAHLVVRAR